MKDMQGLKKMIFEMEKIVLLRFNFKENFVGFEIEVETSDLGSNFRFLVAIVEKLSQCEGFFHENQTRITGH